jgi:hypothetical protein
MLELQDLMNSLQRASDLDLLRLHTAIGHLLRSPARILAIRKHLHQGQEIDYWNARDNRMHHGRITGFKPDQVLVQSDGSRDSWWVMYAALNFDPLQAPPAPAPERRPTRADFAVGDSVSFEAQDLIPRIGNIIRLNPKTATIAAEDGLQWRVSYGALRRVVNI